MKKPTKKQAWVVIAYWGKEATFDFFAKASDAIDAGHDAEMQGADVVVAETWRLRVQGELPRNTP